MAHDDRSAAAKAQPRRPKRTPISQRNVLGFDPKLLKDLENRGLMPRVINDSPGRIDAALEGGYQFVHADGTMGDARAAEPTKVGGPMSKHVGGGRRGYLMAIPKEYYDEDRAEAQKRVDESENAMRSPKTAAGADSSGVKVYGPGLVKE